MWWIVGSWISRSQEFVAAGNGWCRLDAALFESVTSSTLFDRCSTRDAVADSGWISTLLRSNSVGTTSLSCTDEGTKLPTASLTSVSANWMSAELSHVKMSRVGGEWDCLTCFTGPRSRRTSASPWRHDDGFMSENTNTHNVTFLPCFKYLSPLRYFV